MKSSFESIPPNTERTRDTAIIAGSGSLNFFMRAIVKNAIPANWRILTKNKESASVHGTSYPKYIAIAVGTVPFTKLNKYPVPSNFKPLFVISAGVLFLEYIIPEERAKEILLGLTYMDFCKKVQNSKPGREDEWLYIFGKEETFISKYGDGEEKVQLYIKINKIDEKFVAVISFHKQKYKLKYYFK